MKNKEKYTLSPEVGSVDYNNLPKELFKKSKIDAESLHDQAFETKPVSYLRGALMRFAKNKASVIAFFIIAVIILYAIIVPLASPKNYVNSVEYPNGFQDPYFSYALPYNPMFKGSGFWDGTEVKSGFSQSDYNVLSYDDSNHSRIVDVVSTDVNEIRIGSRVNRITSYTLRTDSYAVGNKVITIKPSEYEKLVSYEQEKGIYQTKDSIMKPFVDSATYLQEYRDEMAQDLLGVSYSEITSADQSTKTTIDNVIDSMTNYYNQHADIYYKLSAKTSTGKYSQNSFSVVFSSDGTPETIYQEDSEGNLVYSAYNTGVYTVRVDYFDYFVFHNGFEPYYFFGANASGQDIFLRLASGARFSLLLGVGVSLINIVIGIIWGAIAGYYGGRTDLVMERITDIISAIPSIIILTICSIQFTNNVALRGAIGEAGVYVLAFLVAFVYSGWIGVAGTTRMQFYRFKGQEYVLASRTLGAKDRRLIFKHILPNAVGTLVTSSVLMIPGVIFSESSLSYLGIINFTTSGLSSIGSLLNEGQAAGLQNHPHMLLFPCVIISLLMICFNLFGNGLRDAFNTSLRGSEN